MLVLEWIVTIIFYAAAAYLLFNVGYLLFFAIAGHIKSNVTIPPAQSFRKICLLIPAYKEDAVIIDTALNAVKHQYPGFFEVVVIADGLQPHTLDVLRNQNIKTIEVAFEKSTKGKALLAALSQLPEQGFDMAVVLDADNIMADGLLEKLNQAFAQGYQVVQAHRTAKNLDTSFALLDACNEEINNHIFRLGHQRVGMSSALIGSGMAFSFQYLKLLLQGIGDTAGEDKEIDFRILKDKVKIAYLPDALVYDEKTAQTTVFINQRTRWISTQVEFLKKYFRAGFRELFRHGNIEFFDKILQCLLLPRILLMGSLCFMVLLSWFIPYGPSFYFWLLLLLTAGFTLLLALPRRFYNRTLWQAIGNLPKAFMGMCLALLKIKKANKVFLHTPHTAKTENHLLKK